IIWPSTRGVSTLDTANIIRAVVLNAFSRASVVAIEAASHGFLLPDDPLPRLIQINANRRLFDPLGISQAEDTELLVAAKDLVRVAIARDSGKIDFKNHLPAAQL